ncbi:MAG: LptF/LptG family permease [Flavobacteriales bacterium]|nr:LptF/LptG family permease [Flavobacteriales bacterium]
MLTRLDRFIIKKFLGTFVFMLILLMSISIVFDLSEKLNELIANGAPWDEIIFVYYGNFFLYYGVQFSYLLNFISVIWFTSKMANNTEIVPILSAGVSFNRFLRPYFISSGILVVVTILMYNFVLPASNKARIEFEEMYYRIKIHKSNVKAQISENEILLFNNYNANTQIIRKFKIQKWEDGRLVSTLKAEKATGDSLTNNWHLDFYEIRNFGEFHDDLYFGASVDTTLSFGLSDIVFRPNVIEAMNNSELDQFIEEQKRKGSDKVPQYLIAKHKRWASPFAIFILTLIGVSVSSKKARGGLGINIAIGLIICVLYIFAMQMTTVAALNVGFTPALAVWLPNIVFSFIAYFLYRIAPK